MPVSTFFPNNVDTQELKRDFMTLWSHVVKHLPSFAFLKTSTIYDIPHQYSDVLKLPLPEVCFKTFESNNNNNFEHYIFYCYLSAINSWP